jgi:hypothetical protein
MASIAVADSPAPLVKSPLSSLRPSPKQQRTPSVPNLSSLSMARSTVRAAFRVSSSVKPIGFHHAVQNLAVVHADDVLAARNAQGFHGVGHHHAHLSIRLDAGRADRVGVELHELAEPPGPGFSLRNTQPAR